MSASLSSPNGYAALTDGTNPITSITSGASYSVNNSTSSAGNVVTATLTDTAAPDAGGVFNPGDSVTITGGVAATGTFVGYVAISGPAAGDYPVVQTGGAYYVLGTTAYIPNVTFTAGTVACFAQGTRLLTGVGDVAVEDLAVGDLLVTRSGALRPIRWIGHRHMVEPGIDHRPIRVRADSFGPGVPAQDVRLSPDHAVFADGILIPVRALVNGQSVVRETVDEVTYFHVQLDEHDVVFANGLPCESYLDTDDRAKFDNFALDSATMGFAAVEPCLTPYAPIRIQGEQVEAVRQHLTARLRETTSV